MKRFPRRTVRTRLTLLYTGLFALCGAAVVGVSYALVARLEPQPSGPQAPPAFLARCHAERLNVHPDGRVLAKCATYFQLQGAQHQRHVTNTHLLTYALATLVVALVLAAILSWTAAGRALRPVHAITETARTASERNLSTRIGLRGPRDELRELAETIDAMLDRLQTAFEAQQRFIANASHELRTPLAVMRTTVDVVIDDPHATAADLREMAVDIRTAVDRAEHLIGALLLLARNERGLTVHRQVDLANLAEEVLDTTEAGGVRIHAALEPAEVTGDPTLIERLVANLVDNAVRYNTAGGEVWVSTGIGSPESAVGRLTVANTGPRLDGDDLAAIFEPFRRLNDRTSHEGSGLGLAIVSSIAAIHGGTVTTVPRHAGGLTIDVSLPKTNEVS